MLVTCGRSTRRRPTEGRLVEPPPTPTWPLGSIMPDLSACLRMPWPRARDARPGAWFLRARADGGSYPMEREELDRLCGPALECEVGQDLAEDARKLEPVPRKSAGEGNALVRRVTIDDEVKVRGIGVHACGDRHD